MQVLSELESRLRLRLVTSEFELVSWLYANGSTPSRDLSRRTKASIANFQLIVRRLKEDGVLIAQCGSADRRVREYDLSLSARSEIDKVLVEAGLDHHARGMFARMGLLAASSDFPV